MGRPKQSDNSGSFRTLQLRPDAGEMIKPAEAIEITGIEG